MNQKIKLDKSDDLPEEVKRSLGIGKFKAKVLHRPDGEIIVKATQDIGEVIIKLTSISKADKAKSIELSENELHRILLMAKDVRKLTGRQDDELDQAELQDG